MLDLMKSPPGQIFNIFGDRNRYKNMISIISLPLEFLNHPESFKKFQGPSGRIFHYMEIAISYHRIKNSFGVKIKTHR